MNLKEKGYRVEFVKDVDFIQEKQPGTIFVAPSSSSWNDFGFQVSVDVLVHTRRVASLGRETLEFRSMFGFVDDQGKSDDATLILTELNRSASDLKFSDELPTFFTMLAGMDKYRFVVNNLGLEEARIVFQSINDLVEAGDQSKPNAWLRAAEETPVFQQAFLRSNEAFFAWKNASAILRGVESEAFGHNISDQLRIRFQLQGRANEHDLTFRFPQKDQFLPGRFAVVIGKNGVGKSQALLQIIKAALQKKDNLTDGEGQRPLFNRILAFSSSQNTASVFPSDKRKRSPVWYRRFSLVAERAKQKTSDLIVQLARSPEEIAGNERFEIFKNAIEAIDGSERIALLTRKPERQPILLRKLDSGMEQAKLKKFASIDPDAEPVRLVKGKTYPLSSGEHSFLRFAALASLYIENGSILLFDEPETHLHPNFISQFVALLDHLLEQTGSVAIIATHSVYFVREAFEDQVIVLRSDQDQFVHAEPPTLRTFGADVGAISYFVFGEEHPSRLASEVEKKIAGKFGSWDEVYERFSQKVSLELLGEIRARMEETDNEADEE